MKNKFFLAATVFLILLDANLVWAEQKQVDIIQVADAISPGTAEFIKSGIKQAEENGAACLIIELDTPGGLAESMRQIVQAILASRVPVVVYVSPSGARFEG